MTGGTDGGHPNAADFGGASTALFGDLPTSVAFDLGPALRFAREATRQYRMCLDSRGADGVPTHRPRAQALLFGRFCGSKTTVSDIEFVPNVRGSDETVIAEFAATIAPKFGETYLNPERGFWFDEQAVLRAIMSQAENGLELLGSVHSHPDWHNIGPSHERRMRISENPTQMDEYLFGRSLWPVNVIWYVSGGDHGMTHRVACWRPGPKRCEKLELALPSAIRDEFHVEPLTDSGR